MIARLGFCLALLAFGTVSMADEHADDAFDLRKISCAELTTLPEEEQGYVLVLIFGYAAGASNKPVQSSASIEQQITAAYGQCERMPEETVLNAVTSPSRSSEG